MGSSRRGVWGPLVRCPPLPKHPRVPPQPHGDTQCPPSIYCPPHRWGCATWGCSVKGGGALMGGGHGRGVHCPRRGGGAFLRCIAGGCITGGDVHFWGGALLGVDCKGGGVCVHFRGGVCTAGGVHCRGWLVGGCTAGGALQGGVHLRGGGCMHFRGWGGALPGAGERGLCTFRGAAELTFPPPHRAPRPPQLPSTPQYCPVPAPPRLPPSRHHPRVARGGADGAAGGSLV